MDQKVCIKKPNKPMEHEDLEKYSKEELIAKIKTLSAHNTQLKNIIAKSGDNKQLEYTNLKSFDFSKCYVRHIALKIFYLGWDYKGYVIQEDTTNTIEHHLFAALARTRLIKDRASSNYHRCGRTDKGVSSFSQTISINIRSNLRTDEQDDLEKEINYCKILNKVLPDNIQCVAWSPVCDSFSSRFDCKTRTYKYFFPKGTLDIEIMKTASRKLLGTHDFRNFCKMDVGNGVVEFIRNVLHVDIEPVNKQDRDEYAMYVISIKGKAFLWHQIRCIMGVLFLVGQGKEEASVIDELLDVDSNPRKPEYNMASEIPLNLFSCDYEDLNWYYDEESLSQIIDKLNAIWTYSAAKESMIKEMLRQLNAVYTTVNKHDASNDKYVGECLLQGVKSRKYTPIMKRPTCDSLEDKIKHFAKRNRIEIVTKTESNT